VSALQLYSILGRVDREQRAKPPEAWTIGGLPLNPRQLEIVRAASPEDVQAVHDLIVLDAKALGVPLRCGDCGRDHTQDAP
jgi:hypothetical protein